MAKQLNLPAKTVTGLVTATARSDVNAVDVTAISTDPNQAVALANAAATALNQYVIAVNQIAVQPAARRDREAAPILKDQQSDLENQLRPSPAPTRTSSTPSSTRW